MEPCWNHTVEALLGCNQPIVFFSHQIISIFLSQQISTSHQLQPVVVIAVADWPFFFDAAVADWPCRW